MLRYPFTKFSIIAWGVRQRNAPGDIFPRFAVEHPRVKRPGYRESLGSERTRNNADRSPNCELEISHEGNHALGPATRH